MSDSKKRRMSILDGLAASGGGVPTANSMSGNRALRSARDAVDSHRVWELDPGSIEDARLADRLDPKDVADLRQSIEANGQTVPILVRRHPSDPDRYQLVYGRRRLEAISGSEKVGKVRALIASLDDSAALRAQVSENTARRDLSYIERALFAQELLDSGFGNQSQIAEVLNATRSAVSMAISVARSVGPELARAIGPAQGIGRPRWEALANEMDETGADRAALARTAASIRETVLAEPPAPNAPDPSAQAFEAVLRQLRRQTARPRPEGALPRAQALKLDGKPAGKLRRTAHGLRLDLTDQGDGFAAWFEGQAQEVLEKMHADWKRRS